MSALTTLVERWRQEAEALRYTPGTDAGYTLKSCADELESALAAERARVVSFADVVDPSAAVLENALRGVGRAALKMQDGTDPHTVQLGEDMLWLASRLRWGIRKHNETAAAPRGTTPEAP